MINFIPLFPLSIVVYPGEELKLHVFEPRYKQLVEECMATQKSFGIPPVINSKLNDLGTLVSVKEITTRYENGEMDIVTKGERVFRILEIIKEIPDKLYNGAIVEYPVNNEDTGRKHLMQRVITAVRELHRLLNVTKDFKKPDEELNSYSLAHHAGLSLQQEYELLGLMQEVQRQEYLKRHLTKVIPVLAEMETLKEKVKLNGHFRNLSSSGFEL